MRLPCRGCTALGHQLANTRLAAVGCSSQCGSAAGRLGWL